ncbi:MAG: metallophosphoesterase [Candidatus Eisenbacteria bacterium]|nr:metallophosphoesterase [Candidatus Eisenbacteria bacterium]
MRRIPSHLVALALALVLLPSCFASSRAATAALDSTCKYDDGMYTTGALKVIWKPIVNVPTILRPGDTLTVWANAASSVTGWAASLKFGALVIPLPAAGGGFDAGRNFWVLGFTVPAGTAEEVYDLVLASNATATDTARHAVKVIPAFRKDYYFAQITDTHLPSNNFSSNNGWSTCDTAQVADWNAVVNDFNYIHPEFVLHTGDLVNEGALQRLYHMYEYARAKQLMYRLRDPIFLVAGNHDVGGWTATPVPIGTARVDWWRFFGWPSFASPPAGFPYHSQVYSFDYDSLHVAGMEAYNNYDNYLPGTYGTDSFTAEEMNWLQADLAAATGKRKLFFYHYDFNQGNSGKQINLATLGLDGAIWGHVHSVADKTNRSIPFDLGLQCASSNRRAYRIFRVHNSVITPTRILYAGTTTDSLSESWTGPNDGTRTQLTCSVRNRVNETWDHSRLVFHMVDHDSNYAATGGTVAQVIREGGKAHVYVDCVLTGGGVITNVSVYPTTPIVTAVDGWFAAAVRFERPAPSPFRPAGGRLSLRYSLPASAAVRLEVFDLSGRRVATLADGHQPPGEHSASWDGRDADGRVAAAGLYFAKLRAGGAERAARIVLVR